MNELAWTIGLVVVALALLVAARAAARRFERRQQDLGRWDEYGPLVESEPLERGLRWNDMNERLEVTGQRKGRVLQERRPHQDPRSD
jgi:hypothetical protein